MEEKFFVAFVFIAFPNSDLRKQVVEPLAHEAPPRGTKTWIDEHGFICWDRTVDCNESDKSSCTSFAVCSDWKTK